MSIKQLLELAGVAHLPKAKLLIEQELINEGFKEAQTEFAQSSDQETAAQAINQFRDLVNRNQVQGNERNIDFWRKQGWDAFQQFVSTKSQQKSITQERRSKVPGTSIILKETPEWLIIIPLDKDASCYHGKNTDWCTTKPFQPHFEKYFYKNNIILIYLLQIQTGNKWAIACHTDTDKIEMFDKQDQVINEAQFEQQTGFNPIELRQLALTNPTYSEQYVESRKKYQDAIDFIESQRPFAKVDPKVEQAILFTKNYDLAIEYCGQVKGRWEKLEKLIINDKDLAVDYVLHALKGERWPEYEKAIIEFPHLVNWYLMRLNANSRWPEGEKLMLRFPDLAFQHAKALAKQGHRWPDYERSIIYDPEMVIKYATDVLHGRWSEAEDVVMGNPFLAAEYAQKVIGGRWPEAETAIKRDPMAAYIYAKYTLKQRWPEAENAIMNDPAAYSMYMTFIKSIEGGTD